MAYKVKQCSIPKCDKPAFNDAKECSEHLSQKTKMGPQFGYCLKFNTREGCPYNPCKNLHPTRACCHMQKQGNCSADSHCTFSHHCLSSSNCTDPNCRLYHKGNKDSRDEKEAKPQYCANFNTSIGCKNNPCPLPHPKKLCDRNLTSHCSSGSHCTYSHRDLKTGEFVGEAAKETKASISKLPFAPSSREVVTDPPHLPCKKPDQSATRSPGFQSPNVTQGKLSSSSSSSSSSMPCTFFNSPSGCSRGEKCLFSHTTKNRASSSSIICSFFNSGRGCLNKECGFLHERVPPEYNEPESPPPYTTLNTRGTIGARSNRDLPDAKAGDVARWRPKSGQTEPVGDADSSSEEGDNANDDGTDDPTYQSRPATSATTQTKLTTSRPVKSVTGSESLFRQLHSLGLGSDDDSTFNTQLDDSPKSPEAGYGSSKPVATVTANPPKKISKAPAIEGRLRKGDFTAIVIGETGSGKSTFINSMVNYFRNGSIDNLKVAIPTKYLSPTETDFRSSGSEANVADGGQSQTQKCTFYSFKDANGNKFTLIDTPGLADSRGIKQDQENIQEILTGAEKAKSLSGLIFVVNGTVARELSGLKYALNSLRGSVPDSVIKNAIFVYTNTTLASACVSNASKILDLNLKSFYINNTIFAVDPKVAAANADDRSVLEEDFARAMNTLHELVEYISTRAAVSTADFKILRELRSLIKSHLHKAQVDITELQKLQDKLDTLQKQKSQHSMDAEQFKDFKKSTTQTKKELVDCNYHSTICSSCNTVCHDHCGLQEITNKGDNQFVRCAAFSGKSNCSQCEKFCSHTEHYHGRKTMKVTEVTVEEELADIKAKYDQAVAGQNKITHDITSVEGAKKQIKAMEDLIAKQLQDDCQKIKKICSGFNLAKELDGVISHMRQEKDALTSVEAQKDAGAMIEKLVKIVDLVNNKPSGRK